MHQQDYRNYTDKTIEHLEHFAKEGFRTLVLAYRVISEDDYQNWNKEYVRAATSIQNREELIEQTAELIERNLIILGSTAIEDKLQKVRNQGLNGFISSANYKVNEHKGVAETITMLKKAGIKVWVLTGDKIETAVNIGYSCKLLTENTNLIYLVDERPEVGLKIKTLYQLISI
jgi:magnesium-transporting ATPase (P-type)